MYDRRWLEMQIVRMGEKYPTRVGHAGTYSAGGTRCLMGQIGYEATGLEGSLGLRKVLPVEFIDGTPFLLPGPQQRLHHDAVSLNDAGVPWGEIPKRLGLVPGEQKPAEEEVEQPHEEPVGV